VCITHKRHAKPNIHQKAEKLPGPVQDVGNMISIKVQHICSHYKPNILNNLLPSPRNPKGSFAISALGQHFFEIKIAVTTKYSSI
jgi:hypothetical protein